MLDPGHEGRGGIFDHLGLGNDGGFPWRHFRPRPSWALCRSCLSAVPIPWDRRAGRFPFKRPVKRRLSPASGGALAKSLEQAGQVRSSKVCGFGDEQDLADQEDHEHHRSETETETETEIGEQGRST